MRAWCWLILAPVLLTGCATFSPWATPAPPAPAKATPELLERADGALVQREYVEARTFYREFHDRFPEHPAAGRAGASSELLDRILTLEDRVDRLQRDLDARETDVTELRARLSARRAEERTAPPKTDDSELIRLRRELHDRDAEIRGLKNDLGRLRAIDLAVRPGQKP